MDLSLLLSENIHSIKRHKARTILTGIGITWGMFILILLLGIGNSFRNGVLSLFDDYASNPQIAFGLQQDGLVSMYLMDWKLAHRSNSMMKR